MTWQVLCGDMRKVLQAMPADSIDACVCDPPYGLSREPDIADVMRHWVAGEYYSHGNLRKGPKNCAAHIYRVASVRDSDHPDTDRPEEFVAFSVTINRFAVKVRSVQLNDQAARWEVEVDTDGAPRRLENLLMGELYPQLTKSLRDGQFSLGVRQTAPGCVHLCSCYAKLSQSRFSVLVRLGDNALCESDRTSCVVALSTTELVAVLTLDLRNATAELTLAQGASADDVVFEIGHAHSVRASSGAGGHPPVSKSRHVSHIDHLADGAASFNLFTHNSLLDRFKSPTVDHRGFMGKSWDSFVPGPDYWREVYRVLKPGGHLLAFGGTRTFDLLSIAIRFAGFEKRDELSYLCWIYGSGFPKSLNVSLAIDKQDGLKDQREVVHEYTAGGNAGTSTKDKGGTYVTGAPNSDAIQLQVTRGASEKSRKWDGFGSALKPAVEPIAVFRKPFNSTLVANVLEHGTGAINIDACRVPTDWDEPDRPDSWKRSGHTADADADKIATPPGAGIQCHPGGRWPANALFDSRMAEELGRQSGEKTSGDGNAKVSPGASSGFFFDGTNTGTRDFSDRGTAARFFPVVDLDRNIDAPFFYYSKTSTAEREAGLDHLPIKSAGKLTGRKDGSAGLTPRAGAGRASKGRRNLHPTVKPVALMSWLVRLVTPKGGVVLDPFCGAGSTGIAAVTQGFRFVGVELSDEYTEIARARIEHWSTRANAVAKQSAPPKDERQLTLI